MSQRMFYVGVTHRRLECGSDTGVVAFSEVDSTPFIKPVDLMLERLDI